MDITVCRICLSDGDTNNMVPLINKSENKLTCYGLSLVRITQIQITVFDNLPQFICKKCLLQLKKIIQFKILCENSDNTLNKLLKTLQTEYSDTRRLREEIVQHAMLIHSNIISSEQLLSSMDFVPVNHNSETTLMELKNNITSLSLQENSSETAMFTTKDDEIIVTIESLYNSNYKTRSPSPCKNISYCDNSDDKSPEDNIQLLTKLETMVNEQIKCNKNIKIPTEVKVKKSGVSQVLNDEETLVLLDKMFEEFPECFCSQKPPTSKEFICKVCNKVLANIQSYKRHIRQHNNTMCKLICEHCGKGFHYPTELNLHTVSVHKTGDYFQCSKCPFKAAKKFLMVEHERLHTGERPFACDKCGLTFRRQAILRNHEKYHKEKTVQCTQCPKKFFSKWHMLSHVNSTHERSYLYLCPVCGVKYAKNTTVRRHLLEKHGVAKHLQGKITRMKL